MLCILTAKYCVDSDTAQAPVAESNDSGYTTNYSPRDVLLSCDAVCLASFIMESGELVVFSRDL